MSPRRKKMPPGEAITRGSMRYVDDRLGTASFLKRSFVKVFPDHWSFLLGEIALYTFVILLLTGTYLTLFFHASTQEVIYHGSYAPLRGVQMTEAYDSTLHMSFDVRGGLLMRQVHHWAALLFVMSIAVHMMRVFFTGAFRKPRTINWHIGVTLFILATLEGFAGYSLPDDLLSGTGLRIAYSVMESIPVVGTYVAYFLFGSQYPSTSGDFIPRLFVIHVLLVPGILLALISAHMMIIWHQKHTDFPGPGKTEHNVVGSPFYPTFLIKTNGFLFLIFGVCTALGAFVQINPVWLYGPYDASQVSAGSQPDWYIFFLEGSLRLMPNLESNFLGHTIDWNIFVPGIILPGIMFNLLYAYPTLEAWFKKDKGYHNLLDRPRDVPVRTGLGVAGLTFYGILYIAGQNDVIALTFHWSLQSTTWVLRVLIFVAPVLGFIITRKWCLGLQHHDQELLHHGIETGIIRRSPTGEYTEVHAPLPEPRAAVLALQLGEDGHGEHSVHGHGGNGHVGGGDGSGPNGKRPAIERPVGAMSRARGAIESFFFERHEPPTDNPDDDEPKTLHKP